MCTGILSHSLASHPGSVDNRPQYDFRQEKPPGSRRVVVRRPLELIVWVTGPLRPLRLTEPRFTRTFMPPGSDTVREP